jgi:hypothetical protein
VHQHRVCLTHAIIVSHMFLDIEFRRILPSSRTNFIIKKINSVTLLFVCLLFKYNYNYRVMLNIFGKLVKHIKKEIKDKINIGKITFTLLSTNCTNFITKFSYYA